MLLVFLLTVVTEFLECVRGDPPKRLYVCLHDRLSYQLPLRIRIKTHTVQHTPCTGSSLDEVPFRVLGVSGCRTIGTYTRTPI